MMLVMANMAIMRVQKKKFLPSDNLQLIKFSICFKMIHAPVQWDNSKQKKKK